MVAIDINYVILVCNKQVVNGLRIIVRLNKIMNIELELSIYFIS